MKDILIGQPAVIDTRLAGGGENGLIESAQTRMHAREGHRQFAP